MKIQFSTSGAAFKDIRTMEDDDWTFRSECIRILDKIKIQINQGYDSGLIMDINGNKIGSWEL